MICPNTSSPEWKELINKMEGDELKAYHHFYTNDFSIDENPEVISDDKFLPMSEEYQIADRIKRITDRKKNIFSAVSNKAKRFGSDRGVSNFDERIMDLVKTVNQASVEEGVKAFVENGSGMISGLAKSLDNVSVGKKGAMEELNKINNFIGAYTLIREVPTMLEDMEYVSEIEGKDEILKKVKEVENALDKLQGKYDDKAKDITAWELAKYSNVKRAEFKRELQNKYHNENGGNKPEQREDRDKWVNEQMDLNLRKIQTMEFRHMKNLLTSAYDISGVASWVQDGNGINDAVIQATTVIIHNAEHKTMRQFQKDEVEASKAFRDFVKGKKGIITNQKELYQDIIEKVNGKETQFYTRKMYSEYYEDLSEAWKTINEQMAIDEVSKKHEAKLEDKNAKSELRSRRTAIMDKHLNPLKKKYLKDPSSKIYLDSNIRKDQMSMFKDKYKNPQYDSIMKDTSKKKMYEFLVDFNKKSDLMLSYGKLGYRIPSKKKSFSENTVDMDFKKGAYQKIKDSFTLAADDTDRGNITSSEDGKVFIDTDEYGNKRNRIAVPLRNKIKAEEQSYDLMGLAMTNRYISLNYKEKSVVEADVEVIKHLVGERQVKTKRGGKDLYRKGQKLLGVSTEELEEIKHTKPSKESDSYKALVSIIEDRLYGEKNSSSTSPVIDKLASNLQGLASYTMMSLNVSAAASNVLQGKVMNFLEAGKGVHYGSSNMATAMSKYWSDIGNIVSDSGSFTPKSKTNRLMRIFNASSIDFSGMSNSFISDTKIKKKGLHVLNAAQESGEHMIQAKLMYAILDNIKVKNLNGEYVNKDGNVVSSRNEAASIDEMYKDKDGVLEWDAKYTVEGYKYFNGGNAEAAISRKVQEVSKVLHGNYNPENQAMLQRFWYGKLAMFLRKWMLPAAQRRWRGAGAGIGNVTGQEFDSIDTEDKFFSEHEGEFQEGIYISTIRFIRQSAKGKENYLKQMALNWNNLSDMEKGNVRSAAIELAILGASIGAVFALKGLAENAELEGDDDEAQRWYFAALMALKLRADLSMYFWPFSAIGEFNRTLNNPTSVVSTSQDVMKLLDLLMLDPLDGEIERYKTGDKKGEAKLWVKSNKLLNPIYRQILKKDYKKSVTFMENLD